MFAITLIAVITSVISALFVLIVLMSVFHNSVFKYVYQGASSSTTRRSEVNAFPQNLVTAAAEALLGARALKFCLS